MPVERRSGPKQLTAVVFGIIAVLLAIGLAWGMLALASGGDGPVRVQLGDDEFRVGNAERQARQIAEDGPAIYSDVSGRGQRQPIVVNHFGDDAEVRWVAFPAVLPGASEGCFLTWNAERDLFDERRPPEGGGRDDVGELCSDRTAPPNGEGLEQFGWQVDEEGNLLIDVRGDAATTTTVD